MITEAGGRITDLDGKTLDFHFGRTLARIAASSPPTARCTTPCSPASAPSAPKTQILALLLDLQQLHLSKIARRASPTAMRSCRS